MTLSADIVLTNGMTDEELISYCDSHCETERALFHVGQVKRMIFLSGNEGKLEIQHGVEWLSLHEPMAEMCEQARQLMKETLVQQG